MEKKNFFDILDSLFEENDIKNVLRSFDDDNNKYQVVNMSYDMFKKEVLSKLLIKEYDFGRIEHGDPEELYISSEVADEILNGMIDIIPLNINKRISEIAYFRHEADDCSEVLHK